MIPTNCSTYLLTICYTFLLAISYTLLLDNIELESVLHKLVFMKVDAQNRIIKLSRSR